ncbi:DNA-binding transcriptional LysR family regulator [Sphingomonas leidyi]|uniref:DNA-binding transcriptional LysR family regulator n=1 Tax=Sphingomonas leidyi TaxID=68569 RepID=A0A7X5UXQ1_9SPHN|nr:LysR substrate-binding domain-containing protein [Sphingomonas leidyi]NIJ64073.1 DNA-binding transcriptional LysR family regulator [Sphingomonas leidyi]
MSEGRRLLPPMAALNSFVAAARHGSFSRAAAHIGLTQSAVSRQVALLEDWLQTSLFDRHGRRVTLNAAGRAYADEVRPALDRIRLATDRLASGTGRTLMIATLPSFGMRWLAPRLPGLSARHPEMTVNFAARSFPFDLEEEGFDGAIHFGQPDWPDASHLRLFGERAVVVCSADWLASHPVGSPADLIDKPLLFQASRLDAWNRWFADCGIVDLPRLQGQRFEHFLMLAQAVAAGVGVALIPEFLISPELASGNLVIPFDQPLHTDDAYYLVRRTDWRSNDAMVDFSAWMGEQIDVARLPARAG